MTAKWKQIESYKEAIKLREGKFVMTPDQAQMILDLKKKELQKSKYLSIVDISSAEVKKLAKKDKSIEKVIGKLGGSFRVNLLKSKADSKSGAVGGYRQMKSRTPAELRALRKQMGIKNWDEELDMQEDNTKKYIDFLKKKGFADVDKMVSQAKRLKLKDKELIDYIDKEINKKKNPFVPDVERKFMAGEFKKEDAPTVHTGPAIAGTGDDSSTVVVRKKKKKKTNVLIGGDKPMTRLDGRTKAYKLHAQRLQAQRERRQKLKDSKSNKFTKGLKEKFSDFSREEFIVEDNVAILRDIVKRKQAKPIKLKDGQMKVDGYTASAMVQTLDNKKMKPDTKKKLEFIINKGTKSQFLRTVDAVFR